MEPLGAVLLPGKLCQACRYYVVVMIKRLHVQFPKQSPKHLPFPGEAYILLYRHIPTCALPSILLYYLSREFITPYCLLFLHARYIESRALFSLAFVPGQRSVKTMLGHLDFLPTDSTHGTEQSIESTESVLEAKLFSA